jgi:hypothetical protein
LHFTLGGKRNQSKPRCELFGSIKINVYRRTVVRHVFCNRRLLHPAEEPLGVAVRNALRLIGRRLRQPSATSSS